MTIALAILAGLVSYGVAESLLWREALWGAHFYGFLPRWALLASPIALALMTPLAGRLISSPDALSSPRPVAAWIAPALAIAAGLLFWWARERHLFWGDALPLTINLPRGQSFHPDEPLTLFTHQMLFRLLRGHGSAAHAVAVGSVAAGVLFTGWSIHWFRTRIRDRPLAFLAAGVVLAQGFTQLFYGHVENYSYLAVCLLFFFTLGVDALEGRRHPIWPLLAAIAAFSFHILGGLVLIPAIALLVQGVREPSRRRSTLVAFGVAGVVLLLGTWAAAPLYGLESPLSRLVSGAYKVLANPTDAHAGTILSLRNQADVWSELMLLGPLSLPLLGALALVLPGARMARSGKGAFLLLGAAVFLAPAFVTGPGNLGWARNWDLYAAPAVAAALAGVVLVSEFVERRQARRLMVALFALSLFHTVPWVVMNTRFDLTVARIEALPLGQGRGETMLGTHYLNAGDLSAAEGWFEKAVARNVENLNAQSGLGLARARQGRFREALAPMVEAVRLKPESPQHRYDLIALLLALERWEPAARQLEVALTLEPGNRKSLITLAECRVRLGKPIRRRASCSGRSTTIRTTPSSPRCSPMSGMPRSVNTPAAANGERPSRCCCF